MDRMDAPDIYGPMRQAQAELTRQADAALAQLRADALRCKVVEGVPTMRVRSVDGDAVRLTISVPWRVELDDADGGA